MDDISPSDPCQPSDARCFWILAAHGQLDQERHAKGFRNMRFVMYGITTEFCRCNKSFVSANSETEAFWKSCIIHFPTAPPCSTRVDVIETGDVPILSLFSQMKNLDMTIELDQE